MLERLAMSASATPAVFRCPPELTIFGADALRDGLLALGEDAITVDVTDVRSVDGAGLQVLAAAVASWRRRSLPWSWQGESRVLDEAIALTGLAAVLGRNERT
jgi:anti-anti-sigma regulatory factor